jgi:hypothetical protein
VSGMKSIMNPPNEVDRALRGWLRTHHGLITRADAVRIGATSDVIRGRVERQEWERVFRAVYRDTTRARSAHQMLLAGCLAAGGRSVASHRSAAWLWGLTDHPPPTPEVTIPATEQRGRRLAGLVVHRSGDLLPWPTPAPRNIPCTDPLRTLVDLAAVASPHTLADALDRALAGRLVTVKGMVSGLDAMRHRSGRAVGTVPLRRILAERGFVGAPHPSVLESRALALFRRFRLPVPAVELITGPSGEYRLDFAYPDIRLAVEVDGYVWHFSPEHQRRDHARRNRLQAHGWRMLVYTWRDIVDEPSRVAGEVAGLHAGLALR